MLSGDTLLPACPAAIPTSDDFQREIGLQWQWQANPDPAWYSLLRPGLRLYAAPADSLFDAGQFLSQLMQGYDFDMDVTLRAQPEPGDRVCVGMMGYPYHYAALTEGSFCLVRGDIAEFGRSIPEKVTETVLASIPWDQPSLRLRLSVRQGQMTFFYGDPESSWHQLGAACPLAAGGWTGARPGICCWNTHGRWGGWADISSVAFSYREE